jgi:3-hydroxybutyryl-CoA dehydratase
MPRDSEMEKDVEAALDKELDGHYFEDLEVGMTDVYSRTITESDIVLFCGISGDTNPLHLNKDYAARTRFRGVIAHGMLPASLISAVLGTKLPGPGAIYVSQNCRFRAPVRAGDTVVARATVTELMAEKHHAHLETTCSVGGRVVIDGEATLLVPSREDG